MNEGGRSAFQQAIEGRDGVVKATVGYGCYIRRRLSGHGGPSAWAGARRLG